MSFVHLHVHSHYSLLDGLPKIDELILDVQKKGMKAVALTDHGVMYGAIEFYKKAVLAGIKPILGAEVYIAPNSLRDREKTQEKYFHLVLLAENLTGYKNLLKLVTIGHLEGFYYKPRIDKEVLRQHREGLIGLSACLGGEVARTIQTKDIKAARQVIESYQDILGPGNFFLEIQRNSADPVQQGVNQALIELSKSMRVPMVATNDVHYLSLEDKNAQDILVCVGTGRVVADTSRLDMRGSNLDLLPPETMEKKFSDLPEAIKNSVKIADRISLDLSLGERHFPTFEIPGRQNADEYLRKLCFRGIAKFYNLSENLSSDEILKTLPPAIVTRLEYELNIINTKGYSAYFLVVADFVNWSRSRGIITTTRGSAAGSLTAFALGITTINPVEYKLPFERFLNPYRPSPPDIDIDIADNRRDEVLEYVSEKYGKDKVAQIVTFGTMMARAAIRDVGRALGIPYSKCDKIAKMIPFGKQGFHMTIDKAIKISPDLRSAYENDPETKSLVELSKKVEGCARHASVHAAGVVIAPTKLTEFIPLQMDTDNRHVITQYEMYSVEDAGLIKMDFLGIRNLSILGNAVEIVRKTRGVDIDLQDLPLNDQKTFKLLSTGRTLGVFQLGGSGMTKNLIDLKPTTIFDIMAMISLYRPGPMESIPEFIERKHSPAKIAYLDPRLKEILEMSYGVITYQDDVLLIAIKLAGYSWEEADKLRKAMGKKIPAEMAAQKEKFIQGAIDGGVVSEKAVKLWKLIEPFAAYGFNKAHAASYATVAYQTAFMKANYPVEFLAAVMTAESQNADKIAAAVAECKSMNISVLPPDINESLANFTVIDEHNIRFGLSAIKNLGSDVIDTIISERKTNGQYLSLTNLLQRSKSKNFNKKSWEALVKSGSLDRFGERNQLLHNTESVLAFTRSHQKIIDTGQSALFSGNQSYSELSLAPAEPAKEKDILAWEKEFLGLYVSSHPLQNFTDKMKRFSTPIAEITQDHENQYITVSGIVARIQNILTKKGDQMSFADLEDLTGKLELVIFPNAFSQYRELVEQDKMIIVRGKISDKDGEIKLLVDKIAALEDQDLSQFLPNSNSSKKTGATNQPVQNTGPKISDVKLIKIKIPTLASPDIFQKIKTIFKKYPGNTEVSLVIPDREGRQREIKTEYFIDNNPDFKQLVRKALKESIKTK